MTILGTILRALSATAVSWACTWHHVGGDPCQHQVLVMCLVMKLAEVQPNVIHPNTHGGCWSAAMTEWPMQPLVTLAECACACTCRLITRNRLHCSAYGVLRDAAASRSCSFTDSWDCSDYPSAAPYFTNDDLNSTFVFAIVVMGIRGITGL